MPRPLIGVTTCRTIRDDGLTIATVPYTYLHAIMQASAIPVLCPVDIEQQDLHILCERFDGLMLTGGADIDPRLFNGVPHPKVYDVDPARDELEINLTRLAVENGLPLLGICRGIQVLNVALGGSLYTDLSDQYPGALRHDYYPGFPRDHLAHAITIEKETRLSDCVSVNQTEVNSLHHQGILNVAPGLKPVAWAPDGLVEGVELTGHPFAIGVQWHPESLLDFIPMQALFRGFIEACDHS